MDQIMKVLDQTVREIKREVNLKVLNVPEIEQKVLDATSDEPWGPHGSDLADIARATKKFGECELIMNVLWRRLGESNANWRHVYKALSVIEYILANGSERAVDDIIDNSSQIAKLVRFEYVEPNGKDVGLNVRKKAETVLAIVDDRDKLQQVREKATVTRDKYLGLSSTGITYKSSAASFISSSYSTGSRYGSTGSSRESESFKDSYKGTKRSKDNRETMSSHSSSSRRSKDTTNIPASSKSTKADSKSSSNLSTTSGVPSSQRVKTEDDSDDFNPRGSSTSANASSNHVNLFEPSLMDDLADTAPPTSTAMLNVGTAYFPEVDLFADAAFRSSNAPLEAVTCSSAQGDIDLFAGRSSFAGSFTSDKEFSGRVSPNKSSEQNLSSSTYLSGSAFDPFQLSFATSLPSDAEFSVQRKSPQQKSSTQEHSRNAPFDPSAAVALKSFDGSESFGVFSSSTGSAVTEATHATPGPVKSSCRSPLEEQNFGAFTSNIQTPTASVTESMNNSHAKLEPAAKKETFQVKSSIWADCLSRGLIDLNITAPKKRDLSDAGVVGQLNDGPEEKGRAAPWYVETTMRTASDHFRPGFPSSTGTTGGGGDLQQHQFGTFKQ